MELGIYLLLTLFIGVTFFIIQRVERKRRRFAILITLIVAELIRRYTWYRDVHAEAWLALVTAAFLNILFWLFIGRYNPVASSDDIKVLGLED